MELRTYLAIVWRRIWILALVVGVVALYAGYQYYHLRKTAGALTTYHSQVIVLVGLQPTAKGNSSASDNVTVSGIIADALVTGPMLTSKEFTSAVSGQINQDMGVIQQKFGAHPDLGDWQNASTIGGALTPTHADNVLTISVNWSTAAGAWAVANAAGEVLQAHMGAYWDYVISSDTARSTSGDVVQPAVAARVISAAADPSPVPGASSSKVTQLLLLLLGALIIGLALVFLLEYLDDRMRNKDEIAHLLQLPIYGEIPRTPPPGRTQLSSKRDLVKSA